MPPRQGTGLPAWEYERVRALKDFMSKVSSSCLATLAMSELEHARGWKVDFSLGQTFLSVVADRSRWSSFVWVSA